jgi:glycosyltransferase involved in cell wall biosynthesis
MLLVMTISFVIPFFNEKENLPLLIQKLIDISKSQGWKSEIILVDDGSTDGYDIRQDLEGKHPHRLIRLRKNFGQTAAMQAGIEAAQGEIVVTMDADLQNDPADIPKLIAYMEKGYDVVSGWRKNRQDTFVSRILPSVVANWMIRKITGVPLHDFGCTLKAYRRTILQEFQLYGEMHRFIPVHASWYGAKIVEVEVDHHPRRFGQSKYGIIRLFKVVLDLITVKFLGDFSTKPLYFFGGAGMSLIVLGVLATSWTAYQKLHDGIWVHRNPLFLIAIFFLLSGLQLVLIGLLAELAVRNYYESQGRRTYSIAKVQGAGLEGA